MPRLLLAPALASCIVAQWVGLPVPWDTTTGDGVVGGTESSQRLSVCRGQVTPPGSPRTVWLAGKKWDWWNYCAVGVPGGGETQSWTWARVSPSATATFNLAWTAPGAALPVNATPVVTDGYNGAAIWSCRGPHLGGTHLGWLNGTAMAATSAPGTCFIGYGGALVSITSQVSVLYGTVPNGYASPSASPTSTATMSASRSASTTRSLTSTASVTRSATATGSMTASASVTRTATGTGTMTASASLTRSSTATGSMTASASVTRTATGTGTTTRTASSSRTATSTRTSSNTGTQSRTATSSGSATMSSSATSSGSSTRTATPSPTSSRTPSRTPTSSTSSSASPSVSAVDGLDLFRNPGAPAPSSTLGTESIVATVIGAVAGAALIGGIVAVMQRLRAVEKQARKAADARRVALPDAAVPIEIATSRAARVALANPLRDRPINPAHTHAEKPSKSPRSGRFLNPMRGSSHPSVLADAPATAHGQTSSSISVSEDEE